MTRPIEKGHVKGAERVLRGHLVPAEQGWQVAPGEESGTRAQRGGQQWTSEHHRQSGQDQYQHQASGGIALGVVCEADHPQDHHERGYQPTQSKGSPGRQHEQPGRDARDQQCQESSKAGHAAQGGAARSDSLDQLSGTGQKQALSGCGKRLARSRKVGQVSEGHRQAGEAPQDQPESTPQERPPGSASALGLAAALTHASSLVSNSLL